MMANRIASEVRKAYCMYLLLKRPILNTEWYSYLAV
mgnify:CR=1 FL=1